SSISSSQSIPTTPSGAELLLLEGAGLDHFGALRDREGERLGLDAGIDPRAREGDARAAAERILEKDFARERGLLVDLEHDLRELDVGVVLRGEREKDRALVGGVGGRGVEGDGEVLGEIAEPLEKVERGE